MLEIQMKNVKIKARKAGDACFLEFKKKIPSLVGKVGGTEFFLAYFSGNTRILRGAQYFSNLFAVYDKINLSYSNFNGELK